MATNAYRKQSEDDEQMTRKKQKVDCFDFLSDDILIEILKRLPDDFLRYKAKHICRRFFNVITNGLLLDHTSFIFQEFGKPTVRHVDIREEQQELELKEKNLDLPKKGWVMSWCNEFLLITNQERKEYVFNLITKEGSYLPSCTYCRGRYTYECGVSLSFDGFKGVYKVLHMFIGPPMQCHILILKRNILSRFSSKWKKIEIPSCMDEGWGSWGYPVSVQARYIHWDVHGDGGYLVSMDMVKEKMIRMSLPIPEFSFRYTVFEMGGFLTLIHQVSFEQTDMWILKDFEKMKWEKLELTVPNCFFGEYDDFLITPMSSLISKRYMMCIKTAIRNCGVCSYDLKHGVVKKLDIDFGQNDRCVVYSSSPSFI